MPEDRLVVDRFLTAASRAGAQPAAYSSLDEAFHYIADRAGGPLLLPPFASAGRLDFARRLLLAGCRLVDGDFRRRAPEAAAGLTGVNFALADTGTLVLESSAEPVRLATALPERHFALLDPRKIVTESEAPRLMREVQQRGSRFLAFITGPSRTADIERVLTIGVHGPKELHILLVNGLSDDFLEM